MSKQSFGLIVDSLVKTVERLQFDPPVAWVYNPLIYARKGYDAYCHTFGAGPKQVLLVGMNPGPWGMAQTGVPFGDPEMVTQWLGLRAPVSAPERQHPKRPVMGFDCPRGEVSGRRLWGWAKQRFGTPDAFFRRFWVSNYCPLVFMEAGGRNRTPDKLPKHEKDELFRACDKALYQTAILLNPEYVIGIGKFAEDRIRCALGRLDIIIGRITHPSPANPKANQGWAERVERELGSFGIDLGSSSAENEVRP